MFEISGKLTSYYIHPKFLELIMGIKISKVVTKRVRGLHRALKMVRKTGTYYGVGRLAIESLVYSTPEASLNYLKMTRQRYANRRYYQADTVKLFTDGFDKPSTLHVQMFGRATREGFLEYGTPGYDADMTKRVARNTMIGKLADKPLLPEVGPSVVNVPGNLTREQKQELATKHRPLIKCELSKKFLAAVKANELVGATIFDHMWTRVDLVNILDRTNALWHGEYTNETRYAILKAGRNKLMAALA